ncbi:MAG: hypothetical protein ACREAM_16365 [Blastocatellia bacterium]
MRYGIDAGRTREGENAHRDFLERSNPLEPDTWDPDILLLTEQLILDGKSADNVTKEELRQALLELMSLAYIEWRRR